VELDAVQPVISYKELIPQLASDLPHLINVQEVSCRHPDAGKITCYDIPKDFASPKFVKHYSPKDWESPAALDELTHIPNVSQIKRRIIIVEDLSPVLINSLGSLFLINPEFFEEHLNKSGYGTHSNNDLDVRLWNTSLVKKDYFSLRWYRPVYREHCQPASPSARQTLITNDGIRPRTIEWIEKSEIPVPNGKPQQVYRSHVAATTGNIFRQEWFMSTNPDVVTPSEGQRARAAWEERATIYCTKIQGCDVGKLEVPAAAFGFSLNS
jgi:hypothetical protein